MSTEPNWPDGYERIVLELVDSTNAEALRLAPDIARPTWILAHRQTKARGRRGRVWAMPEGNFAATLIMRPGGNAAWSALRSFLAANAVLETLALYVARDRLAQKWPNDVLLDGGKVAGILLESSSKNGQVDWLSIGIGLNLATAPEGIWDASFPPVALDNGPSPEEFLLHLAGFYATEEDILSRLGFAQIRETWLRHAARLGEVITARTGAGDITGRFETVDEAGQLVLQTPHGAKRIPAADVYF